MKEDDDFMQKKQPEKKSITNNIEKDDVSATDYIIRAEQTGIMPFRLKDRLVPFEMRDLERIENKLGKAKLDETTKDYQNLSFLCAGIFFTVLTFLGGLCLTIAIPNVVLFVALLVVILSFVFSLLFWSMSKKIGKINEHLIEEVLDEIHHLKNKFFYSSVSEEEEGE